MSRWWDLNKNENRLRLGIYIRVRNVENRNVEIEILYYNDKMMEMKDFLNSIKIIIEKDDNYVI